MRKPDIFFICLELKVIEVIKRTKKYLKKISRFYHINYR